MIHCDVYLFIGYLLIACLVGYCLGLFMSKLDYEGRRLFSNIRVVKVNPNNPKDQYCIMVGLMTGYYAATGEEKTYEEIVDAYVQRLADEGITDSEIK